MLAQNAKNRAAYLEEYNYQTKEDQEILHSLHRESSCQGQYPRRDEGRESLNDCHNKHNSQSYISLNCPLISALTKVFF